MSIRLATPEPGLHCLTLETGKGNVIGRAELQDLTSKLAGIAQDSSCRAVLFDASGPDFSFGVSVDEHRPESVRSMLPAFHAVAKALMHLPVPTLFAIRGRCLGGALELALAGTRIFAHPSACLGVPEIQLGVFAPVASLLLPARVGQTCAEELLLSGRTIDAVEAHRIGLVDDLCVEPMQPSEAARRFAQRTFLAQSASSLRFAFRAARAQIRDRFNDRLAALERMYLDELVPTDDAREGIEAFVAKRPPRWRTQ